MTEGLRLRTVPGQGAAARLPAPALVRLVGAAVRLARQLRLDVGALPLLVQRAGVVVAHPLALCDVAARRRRAHRERQRPGPFLALHARSPTHRNAWQPSDQSPRGHAGRHAVRTYLAGGAEERRGGGDERQHGEDLHG